MTSGLVRSRALRGLLIVAGSLSLGLGIIGIFLPLLPTTPFLLLAAWCYSRSSDRFYHWLIGNRWFGEYIRNYREGRGVPVKVKLATLALLWAVILLSVFFVLSQTFWRVFLILIAVGVTVHILTIRTRKMDDKDSAVTKDSIPPSRAG